MSPNQSAYFEVYAVALLGIEETLQFVVFTALPGGPHAGARVAQGKQEKGQGRRAGAAVANSRVACNAACVIYPTVTLTFIVCSVYVVCVVFPTETFTLVCRIPSVVRTDNSKRCVLQS